MVPRLDPCRLEREEVNVSDIIKTVGRYLVEGPPAHHMSGDNVTLIRGNKITRNDLDPPRTYIATSTVSLILTDDPDQLDKIPALELIEPEILTTGPKPGQTWRRKVRHESDDEFNFACMARDDCENKWFVWHRSCSGEAFVILKDDFFADRHNWEQV